MRRCCPHCGLPLRPSVVFFGDTDAVLLERQAAAASEYQAWEEMMEASVAGQPAQQSLAVLEIGCGERVPSVRQEMEDVVRDTLARGGRATHIRINPEADGEAHGGREPPAAEPLCIRDTALRGLAQIEAAMKRL